MFGVMNGSFGQREYREFIMYKMHKYLHFIQKWDSLFTIKIHGIYILQKHIGIVQIGTE